MTTDDVAPRPTAAHPDPERWATAVVSLDGVVLDADQRFCALTGVEAADIVGRSFFHVIPLSELSTDLVAIDEMRRAGRRTTRYHRRVELVSGTIWEGEVVLTLVRDPIGGEHVEIAMAEADGPVQPAATETRRAGDVSLTIDQMRVGVAVIGLDGRALAVNPALCEMCGFDGEELLSGMDLRVLTHPADVDEDTRLAAQVWTGALQNYVLEKRLVRRDGSVIWVRQEVTVVRDEHGGLLQFIAQVIDITDRKQIEHELEASRSQYVDLVERMPIGILSSDASGRIVTANAAAAAIAGLPLIPVGFRMDAIIHPDDIFPLATAIDERVRAGLDFHVEFRIVRPDGTHRWVRNDAHPSFGDDGAFAGLTGTWLDVTGIRAADDLLRQQAVEDQLTGLGNRRFLFDQLDAAVKRGEHGGPAPTVLFVDLDGFKGINDANGHGIGDRVLIEVADRLTDALGPDDVAARIGGDEFVVCCLGGTGAGTGAGTGPGTHRAERVADSLIDSLSDPYVVDGRLLTIGASVGIADWYPGLAPDDLVREADRAVYRAKRDGRGCWRRA